MKRVRVAALLAALSVVSVAPVSFAQMAKEQSWTPTTPAPPASTSPSPSASSSSQARFRRAHPAVGQRHRPARPGPRQPRRDSRRWASACISRRKASSSSAPSRGAAAGAADDDRDLVQRAGARRGARHRRQGGQGLKGKRVGVVVGSPALTQGVLALIGFAGLTEAKTSSWSSSLQQRHVEGHRQQRGRCGAVSRPSRASRRRPTPRRAASSGRRCRPTKEGWARVHKRAPYFVPVTASCGSGGVDKTPVVMAGYAYPIFMTYADRPADVIAATTRR